MVIGVDQLEELIQVIAALGVGGVVVELVDDDDRQRFRLEDGRARGVGAQVQGDSRVGIARLLPLDEAIAGRRLGL